MNGKVSLIAGVGVSLFGVIVTYFLLRSFKKRSSSNGKSKSQAEQDALVQAEQLAEYLDVIELPTPVATSSVKDLTENLEQINAEDDDGVLNPTVEEITEELIQPTVTTQVYTTAVNLDDTVTLKSSDFDSYEDSNDDSEGDSDILEIPLERPNDIDGNVRDINILELRLPESNHGDDKVTIEPIMELPSDEEPVEPLENASAVSEDNGNAVCEHEKLDASIEIPDGLPAAVTDGAACNSVKLSSTDITNSQQSHHKQSSQPGSAGDAQSVVNNHSYDDVIDNEEGNISYQKQHDNSNSQSDSTDSGIATTGLTDEIDNKLDNSTGSGIVTTGLTDETNKPDGPDASETVFSKRWCDELPDEKETNSSMSSACGDAKHEAEMDKPTSEETVNSPHDQPESLHHPMNGHVEQEIVPKRIVYTFLIHSKLCGLFIGKSGHKISALKRQTNTEIKIGREPVMLNYKYCTIEGDEKAVQKALRAINKQFPKIDTTQVDEITPPKNLSLSPDRMQQPTHPSFNSWQRLCDCMNSCYGDGSSVPALPENIEDGVLCVAPQDGMWYRAQIMSIGADRMQCEIKLMDIGGYTVIETNKLRQIRHDFIGLPFQAIECYMANIIPSSGDSYSQEADETLKSWTEGKVVQCEPVAVAENSIPYIRIAMLNDSQLMVVNSELARRGLVKWYELNQ